jgi:hypothetical protein
MSSTNKGYSFGMSREAYEKVFMETRPYVQETDMPGPGHYQIVSFVDKLLSRTSNKYVANTTQEMKSASVHICNSPSKRAKSGSSSKKRQKLCKR